MLRPLAVAVGSSPRVPLYLFGSKEDLVRTLLARAQHLDLVAASLAEIRPDGAGQPSVADLISVPRR